MIKPICKDSFILSRKSIPATKEDLQVVDDLLDTLRANTDRCVGMAANMIGVNLRVIVFCFESMLFPMINPIILKKSNMYDVEEGCLSLIGVRKTTRYQSIEVEFSDRNFIKHRQIFSGFTAQIIQHEVDHCDGILI